MALLAQTSNTSGCSECLGFWQCAPKKRPEAATQNLAMQVHLVVCPKCGSFWEESQRFARIIGLDEAKLVFPKYFKGGKMELVHLEPKNSLELALQEAQDKKMTMSDFLHLLVAAELFIVSIEEVPAGSQGLHPLLFDRDGIPMAAVYTDSSRAEIARSKVKSIVQMKGRDIFCHIPNGYGIVINPGFDAGLELLPDGVRNIVRNYC